MCRTDYLDKTLASLAGLSGLDQVTVYVSQDGQAAPVKNVVQEYGQKLLAPPNTRGFQHWQRDRVPQLGPKQVSCTQQHTICCRDSYFRNWCFSLHAQVPRCASSQKGKGATWAGARAIL